MNTLQISEDPIVKATLALPATQQRLFACRTARRALERCRASRVEVLWAAIEAGERYSIGQATEDERQKANELACWRYFDLPNRESATSTAYRTVCWVVERDTQQAAYWASFNAALAVALRAKTQRSDGEAARIQERALQLIDLLEQVAR